MDPHVCCYRKLEIKRLDNKKTWTVKFKLLPRSAPPHSQSTFLFLQTPGLLLLLLLGCFSRVQLCVTPYSPPGSPVPGILQARTLEWVVISFSNAWKWKVKVKSLSRVGILATPWTAAYQVPPPMGFSRQEYWSGVPLPSQDSRIRVIQWLFPSMSSSWPPAMGSSSAQVDHILASSLQTSDLTETLPSFQGGA